MSKTMVIQQYEQKPKVDTSSTATEEVVNLIRSYNDVVAERQSLITALNDFERHFTNLQKDIREFNEEQREMSHYAMLGQIYYIFQERVICEVYGGRDVPVYTLDEMKEDLQDDYVGHHDSIFKSIEERNEAAKKWESLKEKIGWNEDGPFYDMHGLEYLEDYQYGIWEPRLTTAELKDLLEKARNREWFSEKVLKLFERFISMSEKISVHVM
jgi:DNA repair exonuclease SbcCD ATPase subunit